MAWLRAWLAAFRMLTRLRLPGPETQSADVSRAMAFFPLVGAFVGNATAWVFVGAAHLWPVSVAAVIAIGFGLLLTGGFHEDGASDAADGLGSGWHPEQILGIMRDSRLGAYGAMALWCVLTFRWAVLTSLHGRALWALPLSMALGRWALGIFMLILPPAFDGLASQMAEKGQHASPLCATLITAGLAFWAWQAGVPHVGWACGSAVGIIVLWSLYLRHQMGGYTGDLLGAGNQLVESAVLLCLMR